MTIVLTEDPRDSVLWTAARLGDMARHLRDPEVQIVTASRTWQTPCPPNATILAWGAATSRAGTLHTHLCRDYVKPHRFLSVEHQRNSGNPVVIRLPVPPGPASTLIERLPTLLDHMIQALRASTSDGVAAAATQAALARLGQALLPSAIEADQRSSAATFTLRSATPWTPPSLYAAAGRQPIALRLTHQARAIAEAAGTAVFHHCARGYRTLYPLEVEIEPIESPLDILRALAGLDEHRLCEAPSGKKNS